MKNLCQGGELRPALQTSTFSLCIKFPLRSLPTVRMLWLYFLTMPWGRLPTGLLLAYDQGVARVECSGASRLEATSLPLPVTGATTVPGWGPSLPVQSQRHCLALVLLLPLLPLPLLWLPLTFKSPGDYVRPIQTAQNNLPALTSTDSFLPCNLT